MKTQLKKGFTLVEIMIVVVIIGLLAALAIPAFKKVRNTAVEKTIFNDARQISSAANQYFTENSATNVTADKLVGPGNYISGLSSGTLIGQAGGGTQLTTTANIWTAAGYLANVTLATSNDATPANAVFRLGNAGYDVTLSGNDLITNTAKGNYVTARNNTLVFSVETGQLLKAGSTSAAAGAIY